MIEIVKGMIFLWYGAIVDIPAGYVLCNGANDTPDLRDRFILGAGATFNPDDQGGSTNHCHTFTGDGHGHAIGAGAEIDAGVVISNLTEQTAAAGTTDLDSNVPPYHALAYIMKT